MLKKLNKENMEIIFYVVDGEITHKDSMVLIDLQERKEETKF
jgi:hypothetical protein